MEQLKALFSPEQEKEFTRCFPRLLHFALCEVEKMELSHIMSWEPSGTHFKIHKEDLFITEVAPRFFVNQTKIRSFYRQLNLWGFERDRVMDNTWSREYFLRGFPEGIMLIKRCGRSPAKQLQQQQKKASPSSKAKPKAVAATHDVATTPISSTLNTDLYEAERKKKNEMKEAEKIIRAFSAVLNEISPVENRALLASLKEKAKSSDLSTNENANYNNDEKGGSMTRSVSSNASTASSTLAKNIADDELEEQQSIQQDHEEELLQSTTSTTLPDFDAYMEEEDDYSFFEMGPMASRSCDAITPITAAALFHVDEIETNQQQHQLQWCRHFRNPYHQHIHHHFPSNHHHQNFYHQQQHQQLCDVTLCEKTLLDEDSIM